MLLFAKLCDIRCSEGFYVHGVFVICMTLIDSSIGLRRRINFHLALQVVALFSFMKLKGNGK